MAFRVQNPPIYGNMAKSLGRKFITPSVLNILTNALVVLILSSIGAFLLEE
jgi:hypothetical protein